MSDIVINASINEQIINANISDISIDASISDTVINANLQGVSIYQNGTSNNIVYPAGESISALTFVYIENNKAYKAKASDLETFNRCIGIAITGALNGEDITIQTSGIISDNNLILINYKPVIIGQNGAIEQTLTSNHLYLQIAGIATSNKSFYINIQNGVIRHG